MKRLRVKPYALSKSPSLDVSPVTIHHTEAAFPIARGIYGRGHDDPMDDLDVNMAIWSIFLKTTHRAAVHLGQDHEANLQYVKNNRWNSVGLLFHETGKLISEQKEITGVKTLGFKDATWMSTSLLCDKAYRITNVKNLRLLRLCVVKMGDDPVATGRAKLKGIGKTITSRI